MTVRLLVPYGKYPKNSNLTTGAETEAMLLRTGQADTNTSAGTTYVDPVPTERSGPPSVESTGGVDILRADGRDLLNLSAAQALVSGAGNTTWANRATVLAAGLISAFITDVGVGGSYWDYVGGRWRPSARRVTLKNLITPVSNSAGPKVVLDYCTLLAGIWQDGDILEIDALKTREGGTSDTDATDLMIGTVPATLGTSTGLSSSALATTTIQYVMRHRLRRESATSVRTIAAAGGGGGLGTLASLTTLTTGLTSLDTTEQYLQITSDLTTAGGEVAWLRGFTVTLISGA